MFIIVRTFKDFPLAFVYFLFFCLPWIPYTHFTRMNFNIQINSKAPCTCYITFYVYPMQNTLTRRHLPCSHQFTVYTNDDGRATHLAYYKLNRLFFL